MASWRFDLDDAAFDGFLAGYEVLRAIGSAGDTNIVSIEQRADALTVIGALNAEGGWIAEPGETDIQVFARHMTPVLAESSDMRAKLLCVLQETGVPGNFHPPLLTKKKPDEPEVIVAESMPGKFQKLSEKFQRWLGRAGHANRIAVFAWAVLLAAPLGWLLTPSPTGMGERREVIPPTPPVETSPPIPVLTLSPAPQLSQPVLDKLLDIALLPPHDRTPRQLAEFMAGHLYPPQDPAPYLAAMMDRFPLPATRPVPHDETGGLALLNWAAAIAALEGDLRQSREIGALLGPMAEAALPLSEALSDVDPRLAALISDPLVADLRAFSRTFPEAVSAWREIEKRYGVSIPELIVDGFPTFPENLNDEAPFPSAEMAAAIRVRMEAEAPLDPSRNEVLSGWSPCYDLAPLLLPLAALLWAFFSYTDAVRDRAWRPPALPNTRLALLVPARRDVRSAMLRSHASGLQYLQGLISNRLDPERSIARSLVNGGYLTPIWKSRRVTASHLLLVQRQLLSEHEPRRIAAWLGDLLAEGLEGEIFEYADDPTRLLPFGATDKPPISLAALREQRPYARLWLFTTGKELVGSRLRDFTGSRLADICAFEERAIFTPRPRQDWGVHEFALVELLGAPIGHFGVDGPAALQRWFGSPAADRLRRKAAMPPEFWSWLAAQQAELSDIRLCHPDLPQGVEQMTLPSRLDPQAVAAALRGWLGEDGWFWLGACASYPVLRYPLTVWLGQQTVADPARRALLLAQLCRLPWFATGMMSGGLRDAVRSGLSDVQRDKIESIFKDFYRLPNSLTSDTSNREGQVAGERVQVEWDPLLMLRDSKLRTAPETILPIDRSKDNAVQHEARRDALLVRFLTVGAALALAALLWAIWPDRLVLPLAPGAWVPVLGTLSAAMVATGIAVLRLWPEERS